MIRKVYGMVLVKGGERKHLYAARLGNSKDVVCRLWSRVRARRVPDEVVD